MTMSAKEDVKLYCHEQRFPKSWSYIRLLFFSVTFPLCFVLGVIRLFIGLQALVLLCLLPKGLKFRRYFVRLVLMLLGVFVNVQTPPSSENKPSVIVSNHVSVLDRLIIETSIACVTLNVRDIPLLIRLIVGSLDLTPRTEAPPPTTVAKEHLETSDIPILTLPEQMMTNGRGLLRFASWPFSITSNIQVAALEVKRWHILTPNLTHLFSSPLGDFCWLLCCPLHWINVRYLPIEQGWKDMSPEERAAHAQTLLSKTLDLPCLKLSCHDLNDHKKTLVKQRAEVVSVETLVRQVIDVLPNIPESEIRADLMRTNDTTQTIYNLVNTAPRETKKTPRSSTSKPSSGFPREPSIRANMLELKRAELIADGRRRYIEKHGLKLDS